MFVVALVVMPVVRLFWLSLSLPAEEPLQSERPAPEWLAIRRSPISEHLATAGLPSRIRCKRRLEYYSLNNLLIATLLADARTKPCGQPAPERFIESIEFIESSLSIVR